MAISYAVGDVFIGALESISCTLTFSGNHYHGPIVVMPVSAVQGFSLDVTPASVTFLGPDPDDSLGLTSLCIYNYTVTNPFNWGQVFQAQVFYDG
jgi:hypothetical protein